MGKKSTGGKSNVIHYHHDTKEIHDTLYVGTSYDTTKGVGVYHGRSHSNGKLLFKSIDGTVNMYFSRKEWLSTGNSAKAINKKVMADSMNQSSKPFEEVTRGMVADKTVLRDTVTGHMCTFLGIHYEYGIRVQYHHSSLSREIFGRDAFVKRFEVTEEASPIKTVTTKKRSSKVS